jgi:DNA repair photolyase
VPTGVLVAPVVPGLTNAEIPAILAASKEAGANSAGRTLLRLPLTVAPVFVEWLEREQPARASRVLAQVRGARGGKLNDSDFSTRMAGTGEMARQIAGLFRLCARRLGLDGPLPPLDSSRFVPLTLRSGQMRFF